MKLSAWAKKHGVHYKTAWRWFRDGQLPAEAYRTGTGTILVEEGHTSERQQSVTIYARVSSADQKEDLQRQADRLRQYASANGWTVVRTLTEVGSGLNGHRKKLLQVLRDGSCGIILVEHSDRLSRFGVEYLSAALEAQGRRIVVAEETEQTADLWQDFTDVVTSMCARLYGQRGAKNRAARALEAAKRDADPSCLQD